MKKIGIISDTHGLFDEPLREFLGGVDEIWHAGDFGSEHLADEIAAFKPLRGVWGNIDSGTTRLMFPEYNCFVCEQVRVMMTHIGRYPGRHQGAYQPEALRRILEFRPGIFVCGHSHILKVGYDKTRGILNINPGAAGKYGFHKVRTALRLEIEGDDIRNLEVGEWAK